MTTSDKNKQTMLALLLVVLALSIIYRVTHPFKQEQVDKLTFDGHKHFKKISGNTVDGYPVSPTDIMIHFIDTPLNHSGRVVKNIFRPAPFIHEGGDKRVGGIKKQDEVTADAMDIEKNKTASTPKNHDEFSNFKVFGMYENGQDRVIFLERGKDILALREGDIIDGKFQVQTISRKMVTIKPEHSDRPIHINMNGLENN